jgi:hypothetical protein
MSRLALAFRGCGAKAGAAACNTGWARESCGSIGAPFVRIPAADADRQSADLDVDLQPADDAVGRPDSSPKSS